MPSFKTSSVNSYFSGLSSKIRLGGNISAANQKQKIDLTLLTVNTKLKALPSSNSEKSLGCESAFSSSSFQYDYYIIITKCDCLNKILKLIMDIHHSSTPGLH